MKKRSFLNKTTQQLNNSLTFLGIFPLTTQQLNNLTTLSHLSPIPAAHVILGPLILRTGENAGCLTEFYHFAQQHVT